MLGVPANLSVTVTPPEFDLVPGRATRSFVYEISASDPSTTQADLTLRDGAAIFDRHGELLADSAPKPRRRRKRRKPGEAPSGEVLPA